MADVKKMEGEFNQKIAEILEAKKEESDQDFEELMKNLKDMIESDDPTMAIFTTLFELDDPQFVSISELFLEQLEIQMMDSQSLLELARNMSLKGIKPEDLIGTYEDILLNLENADYKDFISPPKLDFMKRYVGIIINSINKMQEISKKTIFIPIQVMDYGTVPQYAHIGDAGVDIVSPEEYEIPCGESVIIQTGIKMAIPKGYAMLVQPRSGLSAKTHLRIANTPGLIDSGYRGEIGVIIENNEAPIKDITYDFDENGKIIITSILHGNVCHIDKGQKIAQLRLVEVPSVSFRQVDSLDDTERGEGGFGSTDSAETTTNEPNEESAN